MSVDVRDADDRRSQNRTGDAARAADDDHQEENDREIDADFARIDQAEKCRVKRSRETRKRAGIGEGDDLGATRRHTDRLRRQVVVADRLERAPHAATQQVERQHGNDRDHAPGVPVGGKAADRKRAERGIRNICQAAGAAERRRDSNDSDDEQTEGERRHREIVATKT